MLNNMFTVRVGFGDFCRNDNGEVTCHKDSYA